MSIDAQYSDLSLATIKAAVTAAAKKWFYESFEDELLEKMEKAGLIQAEGFSIATIATLQLDIEQAFDAATRTVSEADAHGPESAPNINAGVGADGWAEALLKLDVVKEALTSRDSNARLSNMDAGQLLSDGIGILRVLRDQEQRGAPTDLRFPTSLRKMWSGGEVQQWLDDQGPLYRNQIVSADDGETLQRVYEAFGIGAFARTPSTLLTCIGNTKRFSDLLAAIESEFLMVPGEPSDELEDEASEPDDVCLVNRWGSSKEQYLEQFRKALLHLAPKWARLATSPATAPEATSQI